jgi:hypothetical protein
LTNEMAHMNNLEQLQNTHHLLWRHVPFHSLESLKPLLIGNHLALLITAYEESKWANEHSS